LILADVAVDQRAQVVAAMAADDHQARRQHAHRIDQRVGDLVATLVAAAFLHDRALPSRGQRRDVGERRRPLRWRVAVHGHEAHAAGRRQGRGVEERTAVVAAQVGGVDDGGVAAHDGFRSGAPTSSAGASTLNGMTR
jgi:hypothetical protein